MRHSGSYSALLCLAGALALGGCDRSPSPRGKAYEGKDGGYSDGGSAPVTCRMNSECDLTSMCIDHICTPIGPPSPQTVYDGFVNTLKNDDLEGTLQYFHPGTRGVTRDKLVRRNLREMGAQLEGLTLQISSDAGMQGCNPSINEKALECYVIVDGEEYAIQLMLFKGANGQEEYKIRNF